MLHLTNFLLSSYRTNSFYLAGFTERIKNYSTLPNKTVKMVKPWLHKNINLNREDGNDSISLSTIQKFLESLGKDHNFILIIIINTEQGMLIAPNKKIENVNYLTDAKSLHSKINFEIATIVERYKVEKIYSIVFRYREFVSKIPLIIPSTFDKKVVPLSRENKNNVFSDYYAPYSLDYTKYGQLLIDDGDKKTFLYKDRFILEREFKPENDVESYNVKVFNKNNDLFLSFKDTRLGHYEFIRNISGYSLHIKQGKIIKFESINNCKFIQSLDADYIPENEMSNFITYDLECYKDENNNFVPYAAAWHKNNITRTYYLSDFINPVSLIQKSFDDILVKENKNCIVYIHNNKRFDSIFIFKPLLQSGFKIQSMQNGKNILSLTLTKNSGTKNSIKVTIKDSYLLLPSSLRDLCKSYNLEIGKGTFPHDFASLNNLNYIGTLPSFNLFQKGSFKNFKEYFISFLKIKNEWSFKEQLMKYLHLDVATLHQIILIVRKLTYKEEKVDVTKVLSNAGLSFRIFKMNFLSQIPEEIRENKNNYSNLEYKKIKLNNLAKIAILTKNEYNYMSKAYFGGHTELYIPRIEWGYLYDINSQYPFAMTKLMPIGNPIYSTDTILDNYFGVVRAKITSPKYLKNPILPIKCADGRVRCVLGEWVGTYCSEELKNARNNYGYKVEVLDGYKFNSGYIFKDFVNKFYALKTKYKDSALGSIYKLILNSLYGRFGMKPIRIITEIMNQSAVEKLSLTNNILDIEDYGDGNEMVTYELAPEINKEKNQKNIEKYVTKKLSADIQESHFDINVAISIFITAYARIHIHSYAKNYDLTIYNMDTDSIVTDKPLPDHEVSNELGKMKLEYVIVKGIHSSPKTYWHLPLFNYFPLLINLNKKDKDLIPIVKSKGTGKDISLDSFEILVNLKSIIYTKTKWFKDRLNSTINVRDVDLNIKGGTNKRRMIIKNGIWIDTEPLYINEIPIDGFVTTCTQDLLTAPNYKLLTAPNYKLLTAPNYKLLTAPK